MLTKASAKFIKSLQLKKYRKQEQLFVVEGTKSVLEVINSDYKIKLLLGSKAFLDALNTSVADEVIYASGKELAAIGSFKTNDGALAVVRQKENTPLLIENELAIALDDINDPGNLGTILRIADWYGIKKLIASNETVDLFNPKTIAASKGSFTRVTVFYTDLLPYLKSIALPKYGAFMNGDNIHQQTLSPQAILVMGNEANGISESVEACLDHKIAIPRFGGAESLNVAMATAVICDNFMRQVN